MLRIPSLSYDDALTAISAITDAVKAANTSAVVAVADQQGELLALARLDGAPYPSIQIAANKAFTTARERRPSMSIGAAARDPTSGFDMMSYGDIRYTGFGGGLPVIVNGVVIGAVAVSGLSTEEDVTFAQAGISAILRGLAASNA